MVENEKSQLLYIDKGAYPESIKLLVERNYSIFETPSQLLAMETLILKGEESSDEVCLFMSTIAM